MLLKNLNIAHRSGPVDVLLHEGCFEKIIESDNVAGFGFSGEVIAFPGLINMHDHLLYGLFSKLSAGIFNNYKDWSAYIHRNHPETIQKVTRLPEEVRGSYGELKNIIGGVTTLCDHSTFLYQPKCVSLFREFDYIHSVGRHKRWRLRMLLPRLGKKPVMLHLNEGFGNGVEQEISELGRWNWWQKEVIAIHAISVKPQEFDELKAVIWCPDSNLFLYNRTLDVNSFLGKVPVFFGTDSTLTSSPNIWEHIRLAADHSGSVETVYDMLTSAPSKYFDGLNDRGGIAVGKQADMVIAEKRADDFFDAFYKVNPQNILMVIKEGKVIYHRHDVDISLPDFKAVEILGACGFFPQDLVSPVVGTSFDFEPPFQVSLSEQ